MTILLRSTSFDRNTRIPDRYSRYHDNLSPALTWSNLPDGTEELALVCDDPDAPAGTWVHWVLYKIPAGRTGLEEGERGVGVLGENSWGERAYGGPQPPAGHGPHHYHFKLFALDEELALEPGLTKTELLEKIEDHILAEGEIVGTYERK